MKTRHTSPAAQALYHVFIAPALSKPRTTQHLLPPHNHIRRFTTTPLLRAKTRAPELRTQKWDAEITARQIYLVDPVTNILRDPETGALPPPRTRYDVLNSIDTKTHRLVQLEPDEPGNRNFMPVCKIVDKKESYDAEKRKAKAAKTAKKLSARSSEMGMKTVELNWAIDANDLGHRVEKMKGFLTEGRRVEVVLASKKRGRKASLEECEGVLGRLRAAVESVEGAREVEGLKGKVGGFATMVVLGRPVRDIISEAKERGGEEKEKEQGREKEKVEEQG
ncbi:hypothetical protein M409DRAFT_70091 [Zasmidium cellare ATCC 36951]|uniref:Uncharacterized protein n=1 Tax=Zasmidium cellare ATCC 36951 TaxID=1080233 RepID=A0A6A6C4B0_ZASCE|nr:uncharacterized protein M409DRAFT_70091 [Zasmidium cellare ATCC 36951]KAF2161020.1 hypothetical protein M409DRAFT_70091 [Zasmidium cellare ATCC 36951]